MISEVTSNYKVSDIYDLISSFSQVSQLGKHIENHLSKLGSQLGVRACMLGCSVVSNFLRPTRLLCPGDFPGKATGESCRFHLQGIFLTQIKSDLTQIKSVSPMSPVLQADSLPLSHWGAPVKGIARSFETTFFLLCENGRYYGLACVPQQIC